MILEDSTFNDSFGSFQTEENTNEWPSVDIVVKENHNYLGKINNVKGKGKNKLTKENQVRIRKRKPKDYFNNPDEVLEDCRNVKGQKFIYHDFAERVENPNVKINSKSRLIITCRQNVNHVFTRSYCHHMNRDRGCPQCKKHSLPYLKETFVTDNKDGCQIENNESSSNAIIIPIQKHMITCNLDNTHVFMLAYNVITGKMEECPYCNANFSPSPEEKLKICTAKRGHEFIYEGFLNQFLDLDATVDNDSKLLITCRKNSNHIFVQTYNTHINHISGCPHCNGRYRATPEEKLLICRIKRGHEFIDHVFVDLMKNPNTSITGASRLLITCRKNTAHTFTRQYNSHIYGNFGCPHCSGHYKGHPERKLENCRAKRGHEFINHEFVDLINDPNAKITCDSTLLITCRKDPTHIFTRTYNNHIHYTVGCKQCKYNSISVEEKIEICRAKRGHEFIYTGFVDLIRNPKARITGKSKLLIICRENTAHVFTQNYDYHISNVRSCPHCSATSRLISKDKIELCRTKRGH